MSGVAATSPVACVGLELAGATYRYPGGAAVGPVDLLVRPGEMVLLTGPTGCGKSTVLRLAAGLGQRHGQGAVAGSVRLAGRDPASLGPADRVAAVGVVGQNPSDWIVAGTLEDEVAFGLESAGWPPERIPPRVAEVLARMGLPPEPARSTGALSGGQRQKLVVAAALAGGASLLLLDEPLAQLDPVSARDLVADLARLRDDGHGILLVEHRLEPVWHAIDRVALMDAGRIVHDAPRDGFPLDRLRALGLSVPGLLDLHDRLRTAGRELPGPLPSGGTGVAPDACEPRESRLTAGPLRWSWGDGLALADVSLHVREGERLAVLGANGSGKSTLLSALAGRLAAGPVQVGGRVVDVPQDPDLALFCETVRDELAHGPEEARRPAADVRARVQAAATALSVEDLLDRAPQALSRGQRLRVAVAAAVACEPAVLVLDEPTSGQDGDQVERMMRALAATDTTLVFASHDVELALRHATRVLVLHEGRVVASGAPAEVLDALPPEVPLLVPPLARLCRDLGLPPLTAAEVVARCPAAPAGTPAVPAPGASVTERGAPQAGASGATGSPTEVGETVSGPVVAPRALDPRVKLGLLACLGLVGVALERPLALGLLAGLALLPLVAMRLDPAWWRRGALAVLALTWGTVLSQGLFYSMEPRTPLVVLGPLVVWREGLAYGLVQSLRFTALLLGGLGLVAGTPVDRLMAALVRLRVPFGLAFLALTALRFVPDVAREIAVVRDARARRGRPAHHRSPWAWLRLEAGLVRPVAARSLRRARSLAESLDARGFDPVVPRTSRVPLSLRPRDLALLGGAATITGAIVGMRVLYVLYTADLVWFPRLRPVYAFVRHWL